MIEVHIKTNGEGVIDVFNDENCTLDEVAVVVYRLEQIKAELLQKEFEEIVIKDEDDE